MSNVSFAELFGGYIGDLKELLGCGEVAECNLDSETRILTVKIHFSKYVKKAIIDEAIRRIKEQLMLTAADFTYDFPADKFCPSACADIAEILRVESCQFNGFLDSAKYSLKDNVLSIDLAHGGIETLNNLEFCKRFSAHVKRLFSRDLQVEFTGTLECDELIEIDYPAPPPPPWKYSHRRS